MNRASKKSIKPAAVLIAVLMLFASLPFTAYAAASIDAGKSGSLTIKLAYGGTLLSDGVFELYKVADISDYSAPRYKLTGAYSASGVDLNKLKNTADMTAAASALTGSISRATPEATLTTVNGYASKQGLALGVYLVRQTSSPADYTTSSPFLVFLPMMNAESGEWEYDYTAAPKISGQRYYEEFTQISVQKLWADEGFESERPESITAGLYRNGTLCATQRLSGANGWKYTWTQLSKSFSWTVDEVEVPDGYYCLVESENGSYTITNTREQVPLSSPISVQKIWDDDNNIDKKRPESITVGLYRDGTLYDTQELSTANDWSCIWLGLDPSSTWTVDEINVPDGYSMFLDQPEDGSFVITNATGKVPQTGLVRWPAPVLAAAGALLIGMGAAAGRRKKHEE